MTGTGHVDADRLDIARPGAGLGASPAQDEIARQLQARTGGRWLCWYGSSTDSYWAIRKPPVLSGLVEAKTPEDLVATMAEVDALYGS